MPCDQRTALVPHAVRVSRDTFRCRRRDANRAVPKRRSDIGRRAGPRGRERKPWVAPDATANAWEKLGLLSRALRCGGSVARMANSRTMIGRQRVPRPICRSSRAVASRATTECALASCWSAVVLAMGRRAVPSRDPRIVTRPRHSRSLAVVSHGRAAASVPGQLTARPSRGVRSVGVVSA